VLPKGRSRLHAETHQKQTVYGEFKYVVVYLYVSTCLACWISSYVPPHNTYASTRVNDSPQCPSCYVCKYSIHPPATFPSIAEEQAQMPYV